HDTLTESLRIAAAVVRHTTFNVERLLAATRGGFIDATILAEYLVGKGVPFREAHQHVGRLVALCEKSGGQLADLTVEQMRGECDRIEPDVFEYLGPEKVVKRYRSEGNAGPES